MTSWSLASSAIRRKAFPRQGAGSPAAWSAWQGGKPAFQPPISLEGGGKALSELVVDDRS